LPAGGLRRGEPGAARAGQCPRRGVPVRHDAQRALRPAPGDRERSDYRGGCATGVGGPTRGGSMLITTANDLPGYEVTETLGEVFGLTVRSRNIGSQLGAGLKSVFGGELKGMTKALADSRHQVIDRMVEEAEAKGADAIVAMRFDTSEMGGNWTEICAYGTAVRTRRAT